MSSRDFDEREAVWGRKMIEVRLRFWTNNIAKQKDRIVPKHCWDAGVIVLKANPAHGLSASEPIMFNSLMELTAKIEQLFRKCGIRIHHGKRSKNYYEKSP